MKARSVYAKRFSTQKAKQTAGQKIGYWKIQARSDSRDCDSGSGFPSFSQHAAPSCAANGGIFMTTTIALDWHIVCGSMEIEELQRYQLIKEFKPKNQRHWLFMKIKHPNQRFFKGGWGSEILYFDIEGDIYLGRCGRVYCTYERYKQIADWFLKSMYPA